MKIIKFDLSDKIQSQLAYSTFNHLLKNGRLIELKEVKKTRSTLQNASLHQFFVLISDELNNLGLEFTYTGLTLKNLSSIYSPDIVKNFIFRPIMKSLFNIESTKELTTQQINDISDVLIKFFSEKGIYIAFPSIRNLLDKRDLETN